MQLVLRGHYRSAYVQLDYLSRIRLRGHVVHHVSVRGSWGVRVGGRARREGGLMWGRSMRSSPSRSLGAAHRSVVSSAVVMASPPTRTRRVRIAWPAHEDMSVTAYRYRAFTLRSARRRTVRVDTPRDAAARDAAAGAISPARLWPRYVGAVA